MSASKFIVWIWEDGQWAEQGDGPLTFKQAERIAKEIRHDCRCHTKLLPDGVDPTRASGTWPEKTDPPGV